MNKKKNNNKTRPNLIAVMAQASSLYGQKSPDTPRLLDCKWAKLSLNHIPKMVYPRPTPSGNKNTLFHLFCFLQLPRGHPLFPSPQGPPLVSHSSPRATPCMVRGPEVRGSGGPEARRSGGPGVRGSGVRRSGGPGVRRSGGPGIRGSGGPGSECPGSGGPGIRRSGDPGIRWL